MQNHTKFNLEPYLERIYGYATRRTYSRDEADELAQEIVLAALRSADQLRDPDRFEPWLWGLAANVTRTFRRRAGRERAIYTWDAIEAYADLPVPETEDVEAEYAHLREGIASLSAIYREIVILHYYDGLSLSAIAAKLGLPEGTVAWRLSAARQKLKERYVTMTETALRPTRFKLDIYGTGNYDPRRGVPYPSEYINDALSLNLLWLAYDEPRTVEALAELSGVPAYYIEDALANLCRRAAMRTLSGGRYQTDFFIRTRKFPQYSVECAAPCLAPVMDRLIEAVEGCAADLLALGIHRGDRDEDDLRLLAGVLAFDGIEYRHSRLKWVEIEPNYDGYAWRYLGVAEDGGVPHIGVGEKRSDNLGSRGHYAHRVFYFAGIKSPQMMRDWEINICEDILTTGDTVDAESLPRPMEEGHIARGEDGRLTVTLPAMTRAQKVAFDDAVEARFAGVLDEYLDCVDRYTAGYRALFPARFADDAARLCHGNTRGLYDAVVRHAIASGRWPAVKPGARCDVMIEHPGRK